MAAEASGFRAANLLQRLGLAGGEYDRRLTWRILIALLLLYSFSFAAFYPSGATNDDEAMYLRQGQLVLQGTATIAQINPEDGTEKLVYPSTYPPGTALVLAPAVWLGGVRGAWTVPWVCLMLAVVLTARWIEEEGHSPLFAALVIGFPPALVMGRVAMSDMPSAALVALGFWLFWAGQRRRSTWWLASGFAAGTSFVFRSSNPLLFVPLFAGAVLRRESRCWALVVGGLLGVAVRFLLMNYYFGDFAFERDQYQLAISTIGDRLPLFAFGLLIFVPGGLLLAILYKGRRRPEIISTVAFFFLLYLFQTYSTEETGFLKRLVLALRYYLPLLPALAFAMAEATPRLWDAWMTRIPSPARRAHLRRGFAGLALTWLIAVGVACAAVHPVFSAWSASQAEIRARITQYIPNDAVLLTNWMATRKFLNVLQRRYITLQYTVMRTEPEQVMEIAARYGGLYIAYLARSDSAYWRSRPDPAHELIEKLDDAPQVVLDEQVSPTDWLRIWRVPGAPEPGSGGLGAPRQ